LLDNARLFTQTLPEEQRSGLNPLLQAWERQRENARSQMLAHLHSPDYLEFKRKFNVFLNTPGAGVTAVPEDLPTPCQVREIAPALIYTRLGAVRAFDLRLSDASIERLHALRIEFKKLRYTLEYFKEVLGPEAEMIINELKQLQDHLGALNDAQVATRLLREFIDAWEPQQTSLPINERQNLEMVVTYMAYCHAERHRLMSTFPAAWAHFNRPKFRRNLAMAISVL
jgi:CHAD domain-containing protein